jgi:hypothetical protein
MRGKDKFGCCTTSWIKNGTLGDRPQSNSSWHEPVFASILTSTAIEVNLAIIGIPFPSPVCEHKSTTRWTSGPSRAVLDDLVTECSDVDFPVRDNRRGEFSKIAQFVACLGVAMEKLLHLGAVVER